MITAWRKSSYSGGNEQSSCVEVGTGPGVIGIRDTKNRPAGHLTVTRTTWRAFLHGARRAHPSRGCHTDGVMGPWVSHRRNG